MRTGPGRPSGAKAGRGTVAERILNAALDSFAGNGYAATTMQGVARAAEVDTKLVRYYFRSKQALLAECLTLPDDFLSRLRTLSDLPLARRGAAVVRAHLTASADPDLARIMRTSLLIAAHEPIAMGQVRATSLTQDSSSLR
jgi:AcrR family transcriptional regulator